MDSIINQVGRESYEDREFETWINKTFLEFTEIKCSNNETIEQNVTIQQNISSVRNQIKEETQINVKSKVRFQNDASKSFAQKSLLIYGHRSNFKIHKRPTIHRFQDHQKWT